MTFSTALDVMKNGARIARHGGWTYLVLKNNSIRIINALADDDMGEWRPTAPDILAEDWKDVT